MIGLYFDEIEPGMRMEFGSYHFTRESMVDYARQFDPQPFHVDDAAAARGPFGKLAASGWHTAAGWMKCYVATHQVEEAKRRAEGKSVAHAGPSPGFTDLKWLKPVFAGDTIGYGCTITGKREMASRPEWGLVFSLNESFNQNGEMVFSFEGKVLVARR